MMTRREALARGLPVLGIFRSFAAVGVDPAIMGVGPAVAIPAAVQQVGMSGCKRAWCLGWLGKLWA
jgi:acetyl-CoA acyltransferase 1